jgi:hypothetical protein
LFIPMHFMLHFMFETEQVGETPGANWSFSYLFCFRGDHSLTTSKAALLMNS